MSEWQPIETAPKDQNADVLLYTSEGVEQAWWSEHNDRWFNYCGKEIFGEPTHWMPLPPPPSND